MREYNYLDKALSDLSIAKMCLKPENNTNNDELMYDNTAYHIQQCYEKTYKYIMHDLNGVDDTTRRFRNHDITSLINQVEEDTDFVVCDNLKSYAEELTGWEANCRYPSSTYTSRQEIEETIRTYDILVEDIKEYIQERLVNAVRDNNEPLYNEIKEKVPESFGVKSFEEVKQEIEKVSEKEKNEQTANVQESDVQESDDKEL